MFAIIVQGNVIGFSFIRKKSGEVGLRILAHSISLLQNCEPLPLSHTA